MKTIHKIKKSSQTRKCIQRKDPLKKGDTIPSVIFKARIRDERIGGDNPFKWKDITTEDLFKGKRCVLFALPGAFTPTCSTVHLPGYEELYYEIKKQGIDEVYCISVNDSFVMRNWAIKLGLKVENELRDNPLNPGNFKKVKLIPDGAAKFTRGMGMSTIWDKERGFGERSWRYSAVIDDMKIEKIFIEGKKIVQDSKKDPFKISDAKTMLKYLKKVNVT